MKIKINQEYGKVTVTSSIKTDNIAMLEKYKPDALKLKDADGNEIFGVKYEEGRNAISACGIVFGATDSNGYAKVVLDLPVGEGEDVRLSVADFACPCVKGLTAMETQIATEADAVNRTHQTLAAAIVIE